MKKIYLLLIGFVFAMTPLSGAENSSFFSNEVLLGTGVPIYDDNSLTERKNLLETSDYKRIVAGLGYNLNLNIAEPIKIVFGADLSADFLWEGSQYYHTLDYAFCTGIKVFPGAEGLNVSIAYTLGNRADFFDNKIGASAWGNGFKLSLQYDFFNSSASKIKPLLGAYYRCIPRGANHTDHTLCIYGGIKF